MLIHFIETRFLRRKRKPSPVLETVLIDLSAVLLWRGTWGLMDTYLFPTQPVFSFYFSILLGALLIVTIRQITQK